MFHLQIYTFTHWLHLHPHYAGIAAFVIAFLESIAIVGTIIPGSITMTAIGILIGSGVVPIWFTIFWAISGAFLGDSLSYFFGYYFKYNIHRLWPFSRYPKILSLGEDFFLKHGGKSVFIGRFFGPVRAITPIIAGMFNMSPKRYFSISLCTAILWAPAYLLPGVLLGAVSLEMPPAMATELLVGSLIFLIAVWIIGWLCHKIYEKTHGYFAALLDAKWQVWETQKSKKWFCFLLRHADRPNQRGQLLTALIGLFFLALLFFVSICVKYHYLFANWNNLTYHLFRGFRTPTLHKIISIMTYFGDIKTLLPLMVILFFYFGIKKYYRTAIHFITAILVAGGIILIFRYVAYNPRPLGIILAKTSPSFPSGHVVFSTLTYGFLAFLMAKSTSNLFYRKIIYWAAAILSISVAVSRLYLLQHWFTDILGGYALAFFVLSFTAISYQRFKKPALKLAPLLILCFVSLTASLSWNIHKNFKTDLENSTLSWPTKTVLTDNWWSQQSADIPLYRNTRMGQPFEILNIEWAGNLDEIKKTLYAHDWKDLHRRDYVTTLKQVAQEQKDIQKHFTLFAPLFDDQKPLIEMFKKTDGQSAPLLLRLWRANVELAPHNMPLYVGTVYFDVVITKQHHLIFFNKKTKTLISPSSTLSLTDSVPETNWQHTIIQPQNLPHSLTKKYPNAHIILIRPA
jgi:membrane protein DedA with SNARE-associated domain/membrane-associated phospholipid phosphatase